MTPEEKIPLHLHPDCPRHATAPIQADGRFDPQRFGELLQMQERGATLEEYIHTLRHSTMEPIPLIRQLPRPLLSPEPEPTTAEYECHPDTWEEMPADIRQHFQLLSETAS